MFLKDRHEGETYKSSKVKPYKSSKAEEPILKFWGKTNCTLHEIRLGLGPQAKISQRQQRYLLLQS